MAKISPKNVAKALYETLKDKNEKELPLALARATDFLVKKNLLPKVPEILKQLELVLNADLGIIKAKVLSKNPLSKKTAEEVRSGLKKRYKAREIILEFKEDKTLIGGIRIETPDEVIDLSLKNKVKKLQERLLE